MSEIKFTAQEQAEIDTLTSTKKIARDVKGASTAKQLAAILAISSKTVFKLAKRDAFHQRPARNGGRKMEVRLKGRNPRSPGCDDQSVDQKD